MPRSKVYKSVSTHVVFVLRRVGTPAALLATLVSHSRALAAFGCSLLVDTRLRKVGLCTQGAPPRGTATHEHPRAHARGPDPKILQTAAASPVCAHAVPLRFPAGAPHAQDYYVQDLHAQDRGFGQLMVGQWRCMLDGLLSGRTLARVFAPSTPSTPSCYPDVTVHLYSG